VHGKIIEPPEYLRRSQSAARREKFKYEHADKDGRKRSDPDGNFITDCIYGKTLWWQQVLTPLNITVFSAASDILVEKK
jgi:hypothetical protein